MPVGAGLGSEKSSVNKWYTVVRLVGDAVRLYINQLNLVSHKSILEETKYNSTKYFK